MQYTLNDIYVKMGEAIDVVYLIDTQENTYTALKNTELFRSYYGDSGDYLELMDSFFKNSVDERVSHDTPYGVFSEKKIIFTDEVTKCSCLRFGEKKVYVSIKKQSMDSRFFAMSISLESREKFQEEVHLNQGMNVIKSAYLFTMIVDLNTDKCGTMSMSEIDVTPVNVPDFNYSEWRKIIVNMFLPEDQDLFNRISDPEYLKKTLSYERSNTVDFNMMNLDGKFIWVKLIFHRINTGNDDDFKFFYMVEDIHDSHMRLMDTIKQLEDLAQRDSLTGLLNRSGIDVAISQKIKEENGKPISLLMLDIDHFKQINDTFGHAEGDEVLKSVASLVSERMEEWDGIFGRWGGEEFIGVIGDTSIEAMEKISEEIRSSIEEHDFGKSGKVTVSMGVIEFGESDTPKTAFDRLDAALYKAKESGRNRVVRG